MFVLFALGDLAGRIASSWGPWGRRPPAAAGLVIYALLRIGVAGTLLFCHVVTPGRWALVELPVLQADYARWVSSCCWGSRRGTC